MSNYERREIDGKNYVLIPAEDWDADNVDTSEPNPAWMDFMFADTNRINTEVGLFTNVLLPLGTLLRTDSPQIDEQAPYHLSRILRSVLSVVWDYDAGWAPQVITEPGWYPNPDIILINLAKLMNLDDNAQVINRLKEIGTEVATWLEQMLTVPEEESDDEQS